MVHESGGSCTVFHSIYGRNGNMDENTETLARLLAEPLTTAEAATKWVHDMHRIGYGTHPDDSGESIVNTGGERTFTDVEAVLYDARMGEAFDLLDDVYEVSLDAFHAIHGAPDEETAEKPATEVHAEGITFTVGEIRKALERFDEDEHVIAYINELEYVNVEGVWSAQRDEDREHSPEHGSAAIVLNLTNNYDSRQW